MAKAGSQKNRQLVRWAESLAELVCESKMSELRLECGGQSLRLRRRVEDAPPDAAAPPTMLSRPLPEMGEDFGTTVTSSYVGVFRISHPKTGKPMVKAHDTTETNQVLGWVECMGITYEVVAPRAGTVVEVLVANAEPVEYGQVLLVIQ